MKIPPRRGVDIGRGRPETNSILLEEVRSLRTTMKKIETAQRRPPNEGDDSSSEESPEGELDEDSETTKIIKMLAKLGGKPMVEIPMYEGSLNAEELMDWIRSLDQYFNYEEVDKKKMVKFELPY